MTVPSILTQHSSGNVGLNPSFQNAAAAGDTYANTGKETLLIKNSGPSAITAIIAAITGCNQGFLHNLPISVPSGTTPVFVEVGPLNSFNYNDANNFVEVGYSTVVLPAPGAFRGYVSVGSPGPGVGTYRYAVTFVNGTGETTGSAELVLTTTAGNQVLNLEGIPLGPAGTTKRGIYRTSVGGAAGTEKLALYLNDNVTTSYVGTLPDSVLGAAIPTTNTAGVPAPGAASAATAAGTTLGVGVYKYQVTFTNASGETTGGVEFSITTTTSNTNVALTSVPLGPTGTTSRKIYRTAVGGASGAEKLALTIADNTTTTGTDSTADASLGATIPTTNTASVISVAVTAP